MTAAPISTYDAAIRETVPDEIIERVERFFELRSNYGRDCLDLLSEFKAKVATIVGVPVLDYMESSEGLYLRPHFAESIYSALYARQFLAEHLKFEYEDREKQGSSPDGPFILNSVEFRWPQGPMNNWIVTIIEHKSGAARPGAMPIATDIQTLKNMHFEMLSNPGIDGAADDMKELGNRFQTLTTEVGNLKSEIANFRAH
ncbi:MAG: hypothetical protein FVQ79_13735 [Planctomycetes bacterium]|nr:hypothetical protein [Planctomycetota bacterium]